MLVWMPPDAVRLGCEVLVLDEPLRQRLLYVWTTALLLLMRQRRRTGIPSTTSATSEASIIILMTVKKVVLLQGALNLGPQPAQALRLCDRAGWLPRRWSVSILLLIRIVLNSIPGICLAYPVQPRLGCTCLHSKSIICLIALCFVMVQKINCRADSVFLPS